MRREERVTVQGPVKEQQPGGMSHSPPPDDKMTVTQSSRPILTHFFVIFCHLHVQCIPLINVMGLMIFLEKFLSYYTCILLLYYYVLYYIMYYFYFILLLINWDQFWPLAKKFRRKEMHWGNFVIVISSSQAQPPPPPPK